MSANDLATLEHSIGFARVFANPSDNQTGEGAQNTSIGNAANQYKVGYYVDITNT